MENPVMNIVFLVLFFFFLLCLFIGLVIPKFFFVLLKKSYTRETLTIIFCSLCVLSFLFYYVTSSNIFSAGSIQNKISFNQTDNPCKKYIGTKLMRYCVLGQQAVAKELGIPLDVAVETDSKILYVTNNTDKKMNQCMISIGLIRVVTAYHSQQFTISSHQKITVPWISFFDNKKRHLIYSSANPKFVFIECKVNNAVEHTAYSL